MTWKNQLACQAALAYLFNYASARIADDSDLWTPSHKDWYDSTAKVGVENGVPYSLDADMQRFIDAPVALEGDVSDYMTKTNVQRVQRVLSKT
jgi:hypothetical protein